MTKLHGYVDLGPQFFTINISLVARSLSFSQLTSGNDEKAICDTVYAAPCAFITNTTAIDERYSTYLIITNCQPTSSHFVSFALNFYDVSIY